MSQQSLESLRISQRRIDDGSILPEGQIPAVKQLVEVALDKLKQHQIDRDVAMGGSTETHRFDAF